LLLLADPSARGEVSFNDNRVIIDEALREADTVLQHYRERIRLTLFSSVRKLAAA
jgi:hypothetical protein